MRIFYTGMALVAVAYVAARQMVKIDTTHDLAVPLLITGLWVGGAMIVVGLALWCRQDIRERQRT